VHSSRGRHRTWAEDTPGSARSSAARTGVEKKRVGPRAPAAATPGPSIANPLGLFAGTILDVVDAEARSRGVEQGAPRGSFAGKRLLGCGRWTLPSGVV